MESSRTLSPPNRTCGSPAYGSPVDGCSSGVWFIPSSIFLLPFTPRELPRYYGSSDSCRAAFLGRVCRYFRSTPPAAPRRGPGQPSGSGLVLPWYPGVPGVRHLELRHYLAGSPRRKAESSSSSYGLLFHFQLLPTSSHENAVTFSYKVQTKPWRGLQPLRLGAVKGALGRAFQPDKCNHAA